MDFTCQISTMFCKGIIIAYRSINHRPSVLALSWTRVVVDLERKQAIKLTSTERDRPAASPFRMDNILNSVNTHFDEIYNPPRIGQFGGSYAKSFTLTIESVC